MWLCCDVSGTSVHARSMAKREDHSWAAELRLKQSKASIIHGKEGLGSTEVER